MEEQTRTNPADIQAAFNLAGAYLQMQQTDRAVQVFERVIANPAVDPNAILSIAKVYADIQNLPKLEAALERLVKISPANPEAWYDLAALKATLAKPAEVMPALKQALDLNAARLKREPTARNLVDQVREDARFNALRQTPDFQRLVKP